MMRLLISFDVKERISVPKLLLSVGAERNARRLAVPDEETSGQVVQLSPAVLAVATGNAGNTGSTLGGGKVLGMLYDQGCT